VGVRWFPARSDHFCLWARYLLHEKVPWAMSAMRQYQVPVCDRADLRFFITHLIVTGMYYSVSISRFSSDEDRMWSWPVEFMPMLKICVDLPQGFRNLFKCCAYAWAPDSRDLALIVRACGLRTSRRTDVDLNPAYGIDFVCNLHYRQTYYSDYLLQLWILLTCSFPWIQ
jgi:hypothetical protein